MSLKNNTRIQTGYTHPVNNERQITAQGNPQFFDDTLSLIGLNLQDIDPDLEYIFKNGTTFEGYRLKTQYAKVSTRPSTAIAAGDLTTYFNKVRGAGSGGSGTPVTPLDVYTLGGPYADDDAQVAATLNNQLILDKVRKTVSIKDTQGEDAIFHTVLQYPDLASFPAVGTKGEIYTAADTGLIYTWNGTSYVKNVITVLGKDKNGLDSDISTIADINTGNTVLQTEQKIIEIDPVTTNYLANALTEGVNVNYISISNDFIPSTFLLDSIANYKTAEYRTGYTTEITIINKSTSDQNLIIAGQEPGNLFNYTLLVRESITLIHDDNKWHIKSSHLNRTKKFLRVQNLVVGTNVITHNQNLINPALAIIQIRNNSTGAEISMPVTNKTSNSFTLNASTAVTGAEIVMIADF